MESADDTLLQRVRRLGQAARAEVGARDVAEFGRLRRVTTACEIAGRVLLFLWAAGHFVGVGHALVWIIGMGLVSFHLAVEAQLNHSVQHGAFVGLPGARWLDPDRYESMALPFRARTWGRAHRIHHANPSLLGRDPDTAHGLFRVHAATRFRAWHRLNGLLGTIFVFEAWALDYDRFLKRIGQRDARDRGELVKLAGFFAYQYLLFPLLAGRAFLPVLLANLTAVVIRNFVFVGLQLGSSVGERVSVRHALLGAAPRHDAWVRFQIETSKNFVLPDGWKTICGGLDRHIEHHLFPDLPPRRLHALSTPVRALCALAGIAYEEHPSVWASLGDSLRHLLRLSRA
jgi:linoleoyl-CoA desaturase